MAKEATDAEIKALFADFTELEVGDVSVLEGLIRLHGGAPSSKTGGFAEKVLSIDNLHEAANFLNRSLPHRRQYAIILLSQVYLLKALIASARAHSML